MADSQPQQDFPTWEDYSSKLPAGLPDNIYDAQRNAYFEGYVKPWAYRNNLNPEKVKQQFLETTPRPDKTQFPRIELGAASAARALIDPIAGLSGEREVQQFLKDKETEKAVEATRQGINPTPYQMIGSMAGQLPYWYGGMKLAGLAAASVAPIFGEVAGEALAAATARLETTRKLFNTAAGATIQGGYDAAKAEDGHRMVEGVEGAIEGGAFVGAIEFAGPLWRVLRGKHGLTEEAAKAIEASAKGIADESQTATTGVAIEKDPAIAQTVVQATQEAVKAGKKRGRPKKNPVVDPTAGGVQVGVDLTEAQLVAARRAAPVVVVKLNEAATKEGAATIADALSKGGSIDSVDGDPIAVGRLLREVDTHTQFAGLYDTQLQLRGDAGHEVVVLPAESVQAGVEAFKARVAEAVSPSEELPANPLIESLRKILLDPSLTTDQKRVTRLRLQRLSPTTLQEIEGSSALEAKPVEGTEVLQSPPLEPSAELAQMQELSRKKMEAEGVGQPKGVRLGVADVSEFDHLQMMKDGRVRDGLTGRIYANADQALSAKGLKAPDRFSVENGEGTDPRWPTSYWVDSKGRSSKPLIDHMNWLKTNQPEFMEAESPFIAAQQKGWFRVSGNAIDADASHVQSKGFITATQKAAESAKSDQVNEVYVHIDKDGNPWLSGRVDLPDIGEFLQNPVKFGKRNWKSPIKEQGGVPDRFAGYVGNRYWIDAKGKATQVNDHVAWAEEKTGLRTQVLPSGEMDLADPFGELYSRGFVRVVDDTIEGSAKATSFAIDAAVDKLRASTLDKGKPFTVSLEFPDKNLYVRVTKEQLGEFQSSPQKFVRRYGVEGINFASQSSETMRAVGTTTGVAERPLQTRVTGQAAEDVLPSGTAAGTYAPRGEKPTIYYRNPNPTNMFHEGIHSHIGNLGLTGYIDNLVRNHPTGKQMEAAFDSRLQGLYGNNWPEEAYVYAASAIRTDNTRVLQPFIDADTDRPTVLRWIADNTDELLRGIAGRADSIHQRTATRRLREVLRRSTGELDTIARDTTSVVGDELKVKGDGYTITDRSGITRSFDSREGLVKHLEEKYEEPLSAPQLVDESLLPEGMERPQGEFASHSLGRAPIGTGPPPPPERFATLEPGSEVGPTGGRIRGGVQTISAMFRPFYSMLATVSEKNNWPELYTKFKAIDLAQVEQKNFERPYRTLLDSLRKGVSDARAADFTRYLEAATEDKEKVASSLHITDAEIGKLNSLRNDIYDKLGEEFGIRPTMWIENYAPHLRESPGLDPDAVRPSGKMTPEEMDFFAKHVRTGELDPRDMNIWRITDAYLRLGSRQKFLEQPLKEAAELNNLKTPEGAFVTGTLNPLLKRHIELVRGVPDFTGQVIDGAATAVLESVNRGLESYNAKVPSMLQIEPFEGPPRDIMAKWIALQYSGLLGLRPMIPIRDFLTTFITGYPILGGKYLAIGAKKAFEKGAWETALESGALLENMRSLYRGTEGGLESGVMKGAEYALKPLQWSNNVSRLISFWGHTERALDAMESFSKHGDVEKLVRESALAFVDTPLQKNFVKEITEAQPGEHISIAHRIAKELTEVEHWNYRPGASPGIYKYTLGRLFGQYGTWPLNYIEYARRIVGNADKAEAAKALTRLAIAHGAIISAGQAAGVDTAQWVFTQPMAYGGGPLMNAVINIPGTADFESYRGSEARKEVIHPFFPGMIPGGAAMERVHKALTTDDPDLYKILLGFVPMKSTEYGKHLHQIIP